MNSLALNRPPKISNPDCADFVKMAEQELTAFFQAITKLFGSEQAKLSADDWLQELMTVDGMPASIREWREFTAKVATRLAVRLNTSFASTESQLSNEAWAYL
jgi:hypothetical protein